MNVKSAEFLASIADMPSVPGRVLPTVAFAGRSNVGKSTLINALLNRRNLAKTSSTPGKTRLINYYIINDNLYFADLPGYGFARISRQTKQKWQRLIESFLAHNRALRLVIVIIDSRRGAADMDLQLLDWLRRRGLKEQIVLTKSDKISKSAAHTALQTIIRDQQPASKPILFSAAKRTGIREVWAAIASTCEEEK